MFVNVRPADFAIFYTVYYYVPSAYCTADYLSFLFSKLIPFDLLLITGRAATLYSCSAYAVGHESITANPALLITETIFTLPTAHY